MYLYVPPLNKKNVREQQPVPNIGGKKHMQSEKVSKHGTKSQKDTSDATDAHGRSCSTSMGTACSCRSGCGCTVQLFGQLLESSIVAHGRLIRIHGE
jgi:hypothetical protein